MVASSASSSPPSASSSPGSSKKGSWLDALQMNPKMYWPRKYRFTIEPMPGSVSLLSVKDRDFYEANGYMIVRNLLQPSKCSVVSSLSKLNGSESKSEQEETSKLINQYSVVPNLLKYVECFTGPNIMAFAPQLHPGDSVVPATSVDEAINNASLCHDLFTLPIRPGDKIVCALTILNGTKGSPVYFTMVPGSHKTGNLTSIESKADVTLYEAIDDTSNKPRKQIELITGDTIFFHPQLNHTNFVYKLNNDSATAASPPLAVSRYFASSQCDYVEMSGNDTVVNEHLGNHSHKYWAEQAQLVRGLRCKL